MLLRCTCKNTVEAERMAAQKTARAMRRHRKTADGAWQCETCGRRVCNGSNGKGE